MSTVSSTSRTGSQPRRDLDLVVSRRSSVDSWGPSASRSSTHRDAVPARRIRSTTSRTETPSSSLAGPKFQASANDFPSSTNRRPEHEVPPQRLEDELPGPHRVGVADRRGAPAAAAAITSGTSRSSDQSPPPMTLPARAEATRQRPSWKNDRRMADVTSSAQRLARAVRVVPAQRVVLGVGPVELAVLVALVAGDHHDGSHRGNPAHGVEDVRGAHDVRLVGRDRLPVRPPDERLGGEVEDDLGLALGQLRPRVGDGRGRRR